MQGKTRAWTLVEILVVIAIVCVVAAIAFVALRPSLTRKAHETRVRSDLAQLTLAIHQYRADNDEVYPPDLEALPGHPPLGFTPWDMKAHLGEPIKSSDGRYLLVMNTYAQRMIAKQRLDYPWDANLYPILRAPYPSRDLGTTEQFDHLNLDGKWELLTNKAIRVLGGFEDGHVSWVPWSDRFGSELAHYGLDQ